MKLSVDWASNYAQWSLSMQKILHLFGKPDLIENLMKAVILPPEKSMSSQNTKTFVKNFRNFTSSLKLKGV